jgi:methylglyoxal synthase
MQKRRFLNPSDQATIDSAGPIECNGDCGVRNVKKPSPHPSKRVISSRKRIALVAHDNRKEEMARWALKHRAGLIKHELYATAQTADIIGEALKVPVFRFLSGRLGGDQQIGSRIVESKIDVLIFFWDPLRHQPHDSDVKALLRIATAWNIPNACNEATADCIISCLLFDAKPQAVSEAPNHMSGALQIATEGMERHWKPLSERSAGALHPQGIKNGTSRNRTTDSDSL